MIHNLSHPKGNSVNSNIPSSFCAVSYETIDDCINIVAKLGKDCLIAKADVKDAFYVIRIGKHSFYLLGFFWDGKYYFYTTLPMGLSISCQVFERLSTAIQWILVTKLGIKNVSHILDDFMVFGLPTTNDCKMSFLKFFELSKILGLPFRKKKLFGQLQKLFFMVFFLILQQ